jgi:hypothetical protein
MIADSHLLKLERAREHLDSFDAEAKAWIDGKPYSIVDEADPETPPHPLAGGKPRRFRVDRSETPPSRLSILIGDCVFNLRASLDHLALALARKHTPTMTDKQTESSEFPIFHTGPIDPKQENRKIGCIAPSARTVIVAMQPYQAGRSFSSNLLWQIHELNRIDKHRTLTITVGQSAHAGTPAIGFRPSSMRNFINFAYADARQTFEFKLNAVFLRYAPIPLDPNLDVGMNPEVTPEIVFDQGQPVPLRPVSTILHALCDHVGNVVVPTLSKFL